MLRSLGFTMHLEKPVLKPTRNLTEEIKQKNYDLCTNLIEKSNPAKLSVPAKLLNI